jgi:hypothetical protein
VAEAVAPAGGVVSFREVLRGSREWLKRNWVRTLIFSVLSFLVGWVWNTYIMAKGLEGSVPEPGSTTVATAEGKTWNGIYWLLVATIGFGLVTYARERGINGFFADLGQLPRTLSAALRRNPRGAWAMLLWGMALSLAIATIVSQAIAGVLGLGLLIAAVSPLATIINNIVIRVWVGVFSAAAPRVRDELPSMANPFMLMTGEAVGMLLAYFVDDTPVKLILAVLCGVGGYLVVAGQGTRPAPSATGMMLLAVAAVVAWKVLRAAPVLADDGGWLECITDDGTPCSEKGLRGWIDWIGSDGADVVLERGRIGGYFAAIGAVVGSTLGGVLGSMAASMRVSPPLPPAGAAAPVAGGQPGPAGGPDVAAAQDLGGAGTGTGAAAPAAPQPVGADATGAPPAPVDASAPSGLADAGTATPPTPPDAAAPAPPAAPGVPADAGAAAPTAPAAPAQPTADVAGAPPAAAPEPAAATASAADTGLPSKGDAVAGDALKAVEDRPQVDLKMGVERTDAGAGAADRDVSDLPTKARSLEDLPSKGDAIGEAGKQVEGRRRGVDERMGVRGRGRDVGDLPTKAHSLDDLPSKGDIPAAEATKAVTDRPDVDLKMGVREGHGSRDVSDLPTTKRSGDDLLREKGGGLQEDVLPDEDKFDRRGRGRRKRGSGEGGEGEGGAGDDRVV